MRLLKSLVLLSALTCSAALAATSSSVDYDNASLTVAATGSTAAAVSFTTPSTALSISSGYLRPGAHYTVTVPVTNTTDRHVSITATATVSGTGAGLVTVTAVTASLPDLAAGADGTLSFDVAMSSATDAAAFADKAVTITFDISGTSTSTD